MDPGLWWEFNDGWGTYSLRKYNGRVQVRGWYLYGGTTPLGGTYMGKTLTAATAAAEPLILADRRERRPPVYADGQAVWITYPDSITADRDASVVTDEGGPKVLVRWQATRSTGRGRPVGTGVYHEQRIPRERLKPQGR
jgi:hypothetical protein